MKKNKEDSDKSTAGKKDKIKTRLKWLGPIALGVGFLGVAIIGLGLVTVWSTGWGISLFAPGAVLITVALSSYTAGRGLVSWQEQRERDREAAEYRHREAVYEELAVFMLSRFGDSSAKQDAMLRAKAALWGSADTVKSLKVWHQSKAQIAAGAVGTVPLSDEQSRALKQAFAQAVLSMRSDLAPQTSGDIDISTLLGSIFDDAD